MNSMDMQMQYSMLTWLILFSYLLLLALPFGIRVTITMHVISNVIFFQTCEIIFLTKSEPQHYS